MAIVVERPVAYASVEDVRAVLELSEQEIERRRHEVTTDLTIIKIHSKEESVCMKLRKLQRTSGKNVIHDMLMRKLTWRRGPGTPHFARFPGLPTNESGENLSELHEEAIESGDLGRALQTCGRRPGGAPPPSWTSVPSVASPGVPVRDHVVLPL